MKTLLLLLLLLSFNAYADTGVFTFTAPTERENNATLLQEEIGGFNVFMGGIPIDTMNPLPPETRTFTLDLQPGEYSVTMTTVDTDGRESVFSDPVLVEVPFNPKAPSVSVNITISVN